SDGRWLTAASGSQRVCRFRPPSFDVRVRRRYERSTFTTVTHLGEQPMRYMFIVKGPENLAASGPPPAALFEAIEKLADEATRSGKMVSFGGLHPTSAGARMRITKGEIVTTEGPFTESKEVIGGFSIFKLASMEEALEQARQFTELHRVHWPQWE